MCIDADVETFDTVLCYIFFLLLTLISFSVKHRWRLTCQFCILVGRSSLLLEYWGKYYAVFDSMSNDSVTGGGGDFSSVNDREWCVWRETCWRAHNLYIFAYISSYTEKESLFTQSMLQGLNCLMCSYFSSFKNLLWCEIPIILVL